MFLNSLLTKEKVVTANVQSYDFEKKAFVVQVDGKKELIALEDMSIYQIKKVKDNDEKIYFHRLLGSTIKCILKQNFIYKQISRAEYMKQRLEKYNKGDTVTATVVSASNEALYLEFDEGLSGIMYLNQITSSKLNHPFDIYNIGDKIKCQIASKKDNLFTLSRVALFKDEPLEIKLGSVLNCKITKKVNDNSGYYVEVINNPMYSGIFNIYPNSRRYVLGEEIRLRVAEINGKQLHLRTYC